MPNRADAPNWIMQTVLGGRYDAATSMMISAFHEQVLHEEQLIEAGELREGEQFAANRKQTEAALGEFAQTVRALHNALPHHHILK